MNRMKNIFSIIILLGTSFLTYSQTYPCGTEVSDGQKILEASLQKSYSDTIKSLQPINKTFSLAFFIVNNENGLPDISSGDVQSAIDFANEIMSPAGIAFQLCEYTVIPDYKYNAISKNESEEVLTHLYSRPNRICIYVVNSLTDGQFRDVCGYTYFPADHKDMIFLSKSCLINNQTILAHQLGHLLNLYHTHETIFGKELSDKSNCKSAGDLCCDTYADPNLYQLVDGTCKFNAEIKDPNGEFYIPSTRNLMSFTNGDCISNLTYEQLSRMIYAIAHLKNYLW